MRLTANMRMFLLLLVISFGFALLYKNESRESFSSGGTYAILIIVGVIFALGAGYLLMKGGNVIPF